MLYSHPLSWPEITTLIAALGVVVNASIGFYMMKKSAPQQNLHPLRIAAKRNITNPKQYY